MFNFLSACDRWAQLLGTGLINAAVPSLLIVILTWAVLQPKSISAATRVWAWSFVLFLLVLFPMRMFLRQPPTPALTWPRTASRTLPVPVSAAHASISASAAPARSPADQKVLTIPHWQSAVAVAALFCVGLQFIRLLFGLARLLKLKQQATPLQDTGLGPTMERLVRSAGRRRRVAIAVSDQVSMPFVVGYRRPSILMPAYLVKTLHPSDVERIMLHELAHVERYDDWALLVQRALEAVYTFHPLVRYVARQIDLQREIACDDRVLASLQPQAYATCLTRVAELSGARIMAGLPVWFLQGRGQLSRRLESLLDRTREHVPTISGRYLASFTCAAVLFVIANLNTPGLLAYPVESEKQAAAPPQPPPAPSAGASEAAVQGDSQPDEIDSLTITSGDGKNFSYQNYGDNYQYQSNLPRNAIIYSKNGTQWVIRDSKVLGEAQALLRPQQELGQQQASLGAQQAKLVGQSQAALGAKQAALADRKLESSDKQALQQELRDLENKIRVLAADRSEKTASETQADLADLQVRLGEMQSRMGQGQSRDAGEQAKLAESQSQLGEQQAQLGAMQSKLGRAQAQEAKLAQYKLRVLIQKAEAQHLSQPLH